MYDVITVGSATRDVFLVLSGLIAEDLKRFAVGKGFCFPAGAKLEVKELYYSTGGGGTNTAATFSLQGLKTAFLGMVGKDPRGSAVVSELKKYGIDTGFVKRSQRKQTDYSLIITSPSQDRTILVYHGASANMGKNDIPWDEIKKTKWMYTAPLPGELCRLFEYLVGFAKKNNIKVAANPGNCQLNLPKSSLKKILKNVDVLIINQEEASLLTGLPYENEKKIFKALDSLVPGVVAMTRGPKGVVVSDGKYLYKAEALRTKVIDRTGAGDSFGSGFVTGLIKKNNIVYAIQLGLANAASGLEKLGAKEGLLRKGQKFPLAKIEKIPCGFTDIC